MDAYLAALAAGYTEAAAREVTHVQANIDFAAHGWTEMMEFPVTELDAHYERYADFFEAHGVTLHDPLGEFREAPLPEAPRTPERLEDPTHPHAEGGFADGAYVERGSEVVDDDDREPEDVALTDAPGVTEEPADRE